MFGINILFCFKANLTLSSMGGGGLVGPPLCISKARRSKKVLGVENPQQWANPPVGYLLSKSLQVFSQNIIFFLFSLLFQAIPKIMLPCLKLLGSITYSKFRLGMAGMFSPLQWYYQKDPYSFSSGNQERHHLPACPAC